MMHRSLLAMVVGSWALLSQGADSVFDSKGVKIRFAYRGQGEPVVLIHGWMGDSGMWGKDASLDGFRVIAMDCRGHGRSDKPREIAKYGAEMAADVVRLLDHLKLKKAHLIGYSMGAFIAGKVAATHPDRVLSVVYAGQAPLLIGESGSKEIDVFAKAVDEGNGLGPYIKFVRPKLTLNEANAIASMMYRGKDVKAWALAGQSFKGLEVKAEDLKKCKAPSLFLYGSKESETLKERVAALRRVLPGNELKVVEGGDHVTTPTKPEFGLTIIQFLRTHKSK